MPENVTRFQPSENVKKSLIRWTHIDIMPSRLPTCFHEEPKKWDTPQSRFDRIVEREPEQGEERYQQQQIPKS